MSLLESAQRIQTQSQRTMLTDLCLMMLGMVSIWVVAKIAFPQLLELIKSTRPNVLLNFGFLIVLVSALLVSLFAFRGQRAVQIAAAVFVAGCLVLTGAGITLSGYGVRAQAFYILLICLPFVAFHYGRRSVAWFFGIVIATVLLACGLEYSGVIKGATADYQPYPFVAASLSLFMFITVHLLYIRFSQRSAQLTRLHDRQADKLEESLAVLNHSLARKRSFAKLLSHSTRTPLAGVQFALELLKRPTLSGNVMTRTLASLSRHAFRLRMMAIHLDLSRLAREPLGPSDLRQHVIEPYRVWNRVLNSLSSEASQKQIALEVSVLQASGIAPFETISPAPDLATKPSDTMLLAPWSEEVLVEVVQLLLDNAIKSQTGGTIQTTFGLDADGNFSLEVSDEGSGLDPSRAQSILQPLGAVGDEATMQSGEGLGLGLPVLKTLCDQASGWCGHRANSGGGSVFWVKVPILDSAFRASRTTSASDAQIPAGAVMSDAETTPLANDVSSVHSGKGDLSASGFPANLSADLRRLLWRGQDSDLSDSASALSDLNAALAQRTQRLFRAFMVATFLLAILSLLSNYVQFKQGNELARQAIFNSALSIALLTGCFVLHRRRLHAFAGAAMITIFIVVTANALLAIGMGVRAPIVMLPVAAIALAHFQFGPRGGRITTAISVGLVLASFLLEHSGFLPGTDGVLFPKPVNAVVVLISTYTLSFIAAIEMQGRSEIIFAAMKERNVSLRGAVERATLADQSQSRFLLAVSPKLVTQCRELAQRCDQLATLKTLDSNTAIQLRAQTEELNAKVIAAFDSAIGQVQQEADSSPTATTPKMAA